MNDYKILLDNGIHELKYGDLDVALENINKSIKLSNSL